MDIKLTKPEQGLGLRARAPVLHTFEALLQSLDFGL
jgi:hypothetical protein